MEDKNLKVISDQVADPASPLAGSTMTKAGRLAMELSQEKKRLKQELEELQTEYEIKAAFGLIPKCEICGQEEHTTEEHYTRNRAGSFDADGDGIPDQYDDF